MPKVNLYPWKEAHQQANKPYLNENMVFSLNILILMGFVDTIPCNPVPVQYWWVSLMIFIKAIADLSQCISWKAALNKRTTLSTKQAALRFGVWKFMTHLKTRQNRASRAENCLSSSQVAALSTNTSTVRSLSKRWIAVVWSSPAGGGGKGGWGWFKLSHYQWFCCVWGLDS